MTRDRALGALLCLVLAAALLGAYLAGEARRCDSLRHQHSPSYATYCR